MSDLKKIRTALISVYHKDNLEDIIKKLEKLDVKIYSTGRTKEFISELGVEVTSVEDITSYPSILGGRVKTLHPKIFGGILARRENELDNTEINKYEIPEIDLVIVDLYPFEDTVNSGASESEIIEKIDIGGISLIRAAAKNFKDVLIVSSRSQYNSFLGLLNKKNGETSINDRKYYAIQAFHISSHYDTTIFKYFDSKEDSVAFKQSIGNPKKLRYGENPHQGAFFYGDFNAMFDQLHGKEISYNNLLDIEAAIHLIDDFKETTFAILKHNNPCGVASREDLLIAWKDSLAGDPVSAFGGILVTNRKLDKEVAKEINKLFFEVIIAPQYETDALGILKEKKNRIILVKKNIELPCRQFKSLLNGVVSQEKDLHTETSDDMEVITNVPPTQAELVDLEFANKVVKHSKSNAIVLAKNKQLLATGVGQPSRVDALKQAIVKAENFGFNLEEAVMASDAFFPFPDCVEIAHNAGIKAVVQPGGSIRDNDSIEFCNRHKMAMVFTGIRHFKH